MSAEQLLHSGGLPPAIRARCIAVLGGVLVACQPDGPKPPSPAADPGATKVSKKGTKPSPGAVGEDAPKLTTETAGGLKFLGGPKPPTNLPRWERLELGAHRWRGYTHAVAIGETAFFLHHRTVEVMTPGTPPKWERWSDVLPHSVGVTSAATVDREQKILVAPGKGQPGFVFDPKTRKSREIPALAQPTGRGAQIAVDLQNRPHLALANRRSTWGRVVDGKWEPLPNIRTVNPLGKFSSGLYAMGEDFVAFGDHHMSTYKAATKTWVPNNKLWCQIGIRSAFDRGGMFCQEPHTGTLFCTLGKGSRSFGMVTPFNIAGYRGRGFYYMKPRLPFLLRDEGRLLFTTGKGPEARLNVLSVLEGALFRIKLAQLKGIGIGKDKQADFGSKWEVWNTFPHGTAGDLARERDSVCNAVFLAPYLYTQRKNIARQVHFDTVRHSRNMAGPRFGNAFCTIGSAFCFDGKSRIYVCNGYQRNFWAMELYQDKSKGNAVQKELVPIRNVRAVELAALPVFHYSTTTKILHDNGGGNTAMVAHGGDIYALFDPTTRLLQRFHVRENRWSPATVLPGDLPYRPEDGIDMFSYRGKILVLARDKMAWYEGSERWSPVTDLSFRFSSDGGMATLDPETGVVYVALGGWTRDLATIHLPSGEQRVHADHFPDVVSVPGRRIFIGTLKGQKYLGLFRGHDTAEQWRFPLPKDGRL